MSDSERTITDLQVYQQLSATADALDQVALYAASLVGETALKTAAHSVRGMAKAIYEASLAEDMGPAN